MAEDSIVTQIEASVAGFVGPMETATASLEAFLGPLAAIGAAFEAFSAVTDAITETAEFGKQLEITSQKTGMAAEELSALQYAANLSDVPIEQLNKGLTLLARNMEVAANTGKGKAADAFNALGVSIKDVEGHLLPLHDVLLQLATQFAAMEDGTGKLAIATDLFGARIGASLIPLLNQGADGIVRLEERAKELGVTMGTDGVETTGRYTDAMKDFHEVFNAFERSLALKVIPTLTVFVDWMTSIVRHIDDIKYALEALFAPLLFIYDIYQKLHGAKPISKELALAMVPTDLLNELQASMAKKPAPDTSGPEKKAPSEMRDFEEELNVLKQKALDASLDSKGDLLQIELDFWKSKLAIAEQGSADYVAIHSKIISIEEQQAGAAERATAQAAAKAAEATRKLTTDWQHTLESLPASFSTAIKNMQSSAGSFRDFWRDMWYELVATAGKAIWTVVADHYAGELAKAGITKEMAAERVLTEAETVVKVIALKAWEGIKWIAIEAAKAAASAWSALAGIPVIGPLLGAAAAVAVFAGVMALAHNIGGGSSGGTVASSAGAAVASRSGGGGMNVTIQAMDAKSFKQFAKDNPAGFVTGIATAVKTGMMDAKKLGLA